VDILALLVIFAALCGVIALVTAPLRPEVRTQQRDRTLDAVAELEARKEAKYREIRDAEMDMRTGKLSADDHRVLDRQLRAEAVEILKQLDRVAPDGAPGPDSAEVP
jgi:Na+-translocating ferredoxin:NAD+ oxidoreductase RnfG subunit